MKEMDIDNWQFSKPEELTDEEQALFISDVIRTGKEEPLEIFIYMEANYGIEN